MRKTKDHKGGWIKAFLLLFFLVAVFVFFLSSPHIFAIQDIVIHGNEKVAKEDILALSTHKPGDILWKVKASEIEDKIETHVLIQDAHVVRVLPDRLSIEVVERRPFLYIYSDARFVTLDAEGIAIYIERNQPLEKLPFYAAAELEERVHLGQKIIDKSIHEVLDFLLSMEPSQRAYAYEIERQHTTWTLYTEEGWKVLLGTDDDIDLKMKQLEKILLDSDLLEKLPNLSSLDISDPERPLVRYE